MDKEKNIRKGLGMPGPTQRHQYIIGRIYKNYLRNFPRRQSNFLMGVDVLESPERIPDISIWRNGFDEEHDASEPILTIEITHTMQNDRYSEESIRETFRYLPTLMEAFIYNYAIGTWVRYRRREGDPIAELDEDFSQVLRCHMNTLLK